MTEPNAIETKTCRECKQSFCVRPIPTQDEEGVYSDALFEQRYFEFSIQDEIQESNCQLGEGAIEDWVNRMEETWGQVCEACWQRIPNDLTIVWPRS